MLKTRILLVLISGVVILLMFMLPKVVVNNDTELEAVGEDKPEQIQNMAEMHSQASTELLESISGLRSQYQSASEKEKSAIFADSLAKKYQEAGKFDSSAWFANEAASFFNTEESWVRAGNLYYQAYTFAVEEGKQNQMASKAQEFYQKVLDKNPTNLEVKAKKAMTYLNSPNPMQGITLLREVLAEDPNNETALFNMGMLSIQSKQFDKARERLEKLVEVNPNHLQGHLLLGIAYMNTGEKEAAKKQFEKVKDMDKDPAVHATADSYLRELK